MNQILYPLGEQDFRNIRGGGYLYVDKTPYIISLLTNRYYFLSRPRRFGKSLFLSTLKYFFEGRRELFKGLAIDSWKEWDWEPYPVVSINLSEGSFSKPFGLTQRLLEIIEETEKIYGVPGIGDDPRSRFRNLINALYNKFGRGVVVLVDEYEKPLLDTIDEGHNALFVKELSEFYSVLKGNEDKIRFLFLTGVSRFGHLNIFSGLNNLTDISLVDQYSAICGITSQELIDYFRPGIENLAIAKNIDFDTALIRLRDYYDGYHFSGAMVDIYNPYSLLNCLWSSKFTDKWFQTGSSTYLLKILRNNRFNLNRLEGTRATENSLTGADASFTDSITLLYQSGYLTIKGYDSEREIYTLGIPNREVKEALYSAIVPFYLGARYKNDKDEAYGFIALLESGKAQEAMVWLKSYFSSIPYDVKLNYEAEFQQVMYAFMALVGMLANAQLEKQTANGRIDMVLLLKDFIYVFEFKLGMDASLALDQINSKDYALQWASDHRKVIKIGIAFSPSNRGISDFKIES